MYYIVFNRKKLYYNPIKLDVPIHLYFIFILHFFKNLVSLEEKIESFGEYLSENDSILRVHLTQIFYNNS